MSFAGDVKKEISENVPGARAAKAAMLSAIIGMCGSYSIRKSGRMFLILQSENISVMRTACTLIRKLFHESADASVISSASLGKIHIYTLAVRDDDIVKKALFETKYLTASGTLIDHEFLQMKAFAKNEGSLRAYLAGLFLCNGTISDPNKSYHLEMIFENENHANETRDVLCSFEIKSKISLRKNKYVLYIKEGEKISDVLGIIGATNAFLEFENVRVLRDVSGKINRRVNCETANIRKTAVAGNEQIESIKKIKGSIGLGKLSPELRELAELRLENPDMPLKELGEKLNPPVGKSGIYHRFAKIKQIAEEI